MDKAFVPISTQTSLAEGHLLPLHPSADGASMMTTVAVVAVILGVLASILAIRLAIRLYDARRVAAYDSARLKGQIAFQNALISADGDAVTVFGDGMSHPLCHESANALLKSAMDGPDSRVLAIALSRLMQDGVAFEIIARTSVKGDAISLRGQVVMNRRVVFAKKCSSPVPVDYQAVLDAVSVPIWVRGPDLSLRWGNHAFLDVTNSGTLQNALTSNSSLQRSELDLASAALEGAVNAEGVRYALVDGERRAFEMKLARLRDFTVAGIAVDVTGKAQAEGRLRLNAEATSDMLEGLPIAVAIFDKEQRLQSWNAAYGAVWKFSEEWLETHPTQGDVLDRLRGMRQLPEQHDYAAWKADQISLFKDTAQQREELWHLANGRSLRVISRPYLLGGIVVMVQDISEMIRTEAAYKLLAQVQRATLDVIEDGMAIFGPDGRLVLSNRSFAKLWNLEEEELKAEPHFSKLADIAATRIGPDSFWNILATGIMSAEPQRCNEWGTARRADGKVLSLSMARLPNGATIATFSDLTDLASFEKHKEVSHVAA